MSETPVPGGRYVRALGPYLGVALYDPVVAVTMRERLFRRLLAEQVLDAPAGNASLEIVDVGCGTGTLAIALAAGGARVTAVDGDPEILQRAERKDGSSPVEWLVGRADALAVSDASCDRVVFSLVLHHLPDDVKLAALSEAWRVLRPSGRVHVADYGKPGDPLMRAAFGALQLIDGRANTQTLGAGRLPGLIERTGFTGYARHDRIRTAAGCLELSSAEKPPAA